MMEIDDYILTKQVGRGSFGEVYLSTRKGTNQFYAIKKIPKSKALQAEYRKYFNNEIFILKHINHPNIIKLVEIKQTKSNFYLVQEFCNGGDLSKLLENKMLSTGYPFTQDIVQFLMKQICAGLNYIHSKQIIHRDLKLENILVHFQNQNDLNSNNLFGAQIKIIDFGFARYLPAGQCAGSVLGTPQNMDPKILGKFAGENINDFRYDEKADIWSLGTLCFQMLIGSVPFAGSNYQEIMQRIHQGKIKIPSNIQLSQECISFLNAMLQYDSNKRLPIRELCKHIFLTGDVRNFRPINLRGDLVLNIFKNNQFSSQMNTGAPNASVWDMFGSGMQSLAGIMGNMMGSNNSPDVSYQFGGGLVGAPEDYLGAMNNNMENSMNSYNPGYSFNDQGINKNYNQSKTFDTPYNSITMNAAPPNVGNNMGNQVNQYMGMNQNNNLLHANTLPNFNNSNQGYNFVGNIYGNQNQNINLNQNQNQNPRVIVIKQNSNNNSPLEQMTQDCTIW